MFRTKNLGRHGLLARHVVHVLPGAPFGGAQRMAINIARAQRHRGLVADVLFTDVAQDAEAAARMASVPFSSPAIETTSAWRRMRFVRSYLRASRPDVIHLHVPPPWIVLSLPLPLRNSAAVVAQLHL